MAWFQRCIFMANLELSLPISELYFLGSINSKFQLFASIILFYFSIWNKMTWGNPGQTTVLRATEGSKIFISMLMTGRLWWWGIMKITRRLTIHFGDTIVIMMISTMMTNYYSWNDDHNDDHGNTHHNVYDENIIHLKSWKTIPGFPTKKAYLDVPGS